MPNVLGHQRLVPSPSSTLLSVVLGAEPELAATRAPIATFKPEGNDGSAAAGVAE
jgi:hypothetical protein